jgi:hypothetical protein
LKTTFTAVVLASLVHLYAVSHAQAQDKYYAVIFGVQDAANRFNQAHSFATFVKAKRDPATIVDQATIRWLPASGIVDLKNRPERGTNHTLKNSFEIVTRAQSVAQWGPFEIREELFDRAKRQEQHLKSGAILYKAVDLLTRSPGVAINCEHSISDIVRNPGDSFHRTGTARGHRGSFLVAEHLRPWMIESNTVHPWVEVPLGLGDFTIVKKSWNWPN